MLHIGPKKVCGAGYVEVSGKRVRQMVYRQSDGRMEQAQDAINDCMQYSAIE